MSGFTTTQYDNTVEILKFRTHQSIAVTVSDAGVTANTDGKKIVPAGTIIGGTPTPFLEDSTNMVTAHNDASAEGVLRHSVDVTNGPAAGAMVVHGWIDLTKLPEPPDADAIAALKMIQFVGE